MVPPTADSLSTSLAAWSWEVINYQNEMLGQSILALVILSKVEVGKEILTKLSLLMNCRSRHKNQSTDNHNSRTTFHSLRIDETGLVRIFKLLVMEKVLLQTFLILVSPLPLHLHNAALAPLHTLPGLHLQLVDTVQLGRVTYLRLVMI